MLTAAFNRLDTARYLLSAGADPRKTNCDGASAEVIAAGKGFTELSDLLSGRSSGTPASSPVSPPQQVQVNNTDEPDAPQEPVYEELHAVDDACASVDDGSDDDCNEDVSDMIEFMKRREATQLDDLKQELEKNKQVLNQAVREHEDDIHTREQTLADIQQQLSEAQKLEEEMKRDLKRISKDIDVLQRQDLEMRNEISTRARKFSHSKSVQERKVDESRSKLRKFVMDMKTKVKDRASASETGTSSNMIRPPSMYDGLNMESELECPICFELSRPPVYQCPEGHIICHNCRPRVSRCPVCRFVFKVSLKLLRTLIDNVVYQGPDIRNRFIEKMSEYYFSMEV